MDEHREEGPKRLEPADAAGLTGAARHAQPCEGPPATDEPWLAAAGLRSGRTCSFEQAEGMDARALGAAAEHARQFIDALLSAHFLYL